MNMQQMVQAVQKMQRQYEKEHKILEEKDFEYTANGLVKCTMKGNLTMTKVEILDKDALTSDNKEMLEEMFALAYNGCKDLIMAEEDKLAEKYKAAGNGGFPF